MSNLAATSLAPLACPRCGAAATGYEGCPRCRAEGVAVNLVPPLADLRGKNLAGYAGGPWAWPDTLPVRDGPALGLRLGLGLGEGDTPVVLVDERDGCHLWIKDESRNPTGSHKDRAMAVGVAAARQAGADTVVVASSGNAGAAAAAFAARAGLHCVVLTATATGVQAAQIRALGAALIGLPDRATRNETMAVAVRELGWYPLTNYVLPVAGDNPYGIEGYKSIAYELARDRGSEIDVVVVPTSGADVLAGIERGYRELAAAGLVDRVPRLVAAETATAAAFSAALRHADRSAQERARVPWRSSPAWSIGSTEPTWQGLNALWRTGGEAVALEVDDYMAEHRTLPPATGLYFEPASAVAIRAARRLVDDGVRDVVALGTGSGLKGLGEPTPLPTAGTVSELAELAALASASAATPVPAAG